MTDSDHRPKLSVYLLGLKHLGQNTLKKHWSDSTTSTALRNIADVELIVAVETDFRNLLPAVDVKSSVFLVLYSPEAKESIDYCSGCVRGLLSAFNRLKPRIMLLENSKSEETGDKETNRPFPEIFGQFSLLRIFRVDVECTASLAPVFKEAIAGSVFQSLEEVDIQQIFTTACNNGQSELLKLLLTLERDSDPLKWLKDILSSLEQLTCTDKSVANLLQAAEVMHNLEPEKSRAFLHQQSTEFPRGSLMVLNRYSDPSNQSAQVLVLPGAGLKELSPLSIADVRYTHISLPGNSLTSIPEELFQLQTLLTLNLSNNSLQKVPPVIRWNCPKLRELNLSHNLLVDTPPGLFKSAAQGRRVSMYVGVSNESHAAPQRMVLRLTGQNLYPCIHSLIILNISHNPKLTQVPEWVCVLPHLSLLNLQGLPKLTSLRQELGYWESLSIIQIEPDKMISPPAEVCAQRSQAFIAYLKCQLKGLSHYRHMRLMLLGGKSSGKTTTFNSLIKSKASSASSIATDMPSYDYRGEVSGGQHLKITYHLMDFSSHAVGHLVYQCFLVKRCIYLCFWNLQDGKDGLKTLLPILKSLHAHLPDAQVFLIGTHSDQVTNVTTTDVLGWAKEAFGVDYPSSLHNHQYADSCGLPCIARSILINSLEGEDMENLKRDIHWMAGEMLGYSAQPKTEEMVPRLFSSLQGIVDTRLKRNRHQPNILKYEEFFDSLKSVSGDFSDEEKEFNLACEFLQEAGVLITQSVTGSSDVFFLDPQWLSDAISKSLDHLQQEVGERGVTIAASLLERTVQLSGVPQSNVEAFVRLLEQKRFITPLDMEKTQFLLLYLLPPHPPSKYRPCDLSTPDTLVQMISCKCIPEGLFLFLQSQIITSLYRLGAQLMVISKAKQTGVPLTEAKPFANYSGVSSIRRGKAFTLSREGYVENSSRREMEDSRSQMDRMRAMSFSSRVDTINRNFAHMKFKPISTDVFTSSLKFAPEPLLASSWISDGTFWQSLLWREGMYIEFGDRTAAWVECKDSTVAIATQGIEQACVKTLTFLSTCFQSVLEDRFPNLNATYFTPCVQCLSKLVPEECCLGPSLNEKVTFFNQSEILSSCIDPEQRLKCHKCDNEADLKKMTPEIFLLDFSANYRLEDSLLELAESKDTLLGQGRYAKVYSGCYDNKQVAVKMFKYSKENQLKQFRTLRSELNILTNLSHPHLLTPIGALLRSFALVFPLAPLGSLRDHIQLCSCGFDDQVSHKLLYQIASGLQYLHSLYIIHRDIKPSNILVWSLHPTRGVLVKISDCGLSQFSTPSGLSLQMGTEEFMAPELFMAGRKLPYNEKVDIFSFGVMLYSIVSGKSLVPGLLYKTDSQTTNTSLSLGQAITSSMEEQRPRDPVSDTSLSILEDGVHPASRRGFVSMCVAKCLQTLLKDCLWKDPSRRPSAEGVCSHLLLCTAPSTQERIIIQQNFPVVGAVEIPSMDSIAAWGSNGGQFLTVSKGVWSVKTLSLPLQEFFTQGNNVICVVDSMVYIASCSTRRIQSVDIQGMSNQLAPKNALPSNPCSVFASQDGKQVFVGLEGGRIARFTSHGVMFEDAPLIGKAMDHPDRKKTPIRCGLVHEGVVICGCGRYLIGLESSNFQQKFYKPLTNQGTMINGIIRVSNNTLWVWFSDSTEIVICDISTGNRLDSIDVRKCLQENIPHVSTIAVTTVSSSPASSTVWVGTNTGHVMGFECSTLELHVAVQQHSCVESIVALDDGMVLLVFGKWKFEQENMMEGFSVWHSHGNMSHSE